MFRMRSASEGQSLLEVVVLIGLALVIVTGLTIVTVNGLRNSQFSQNQAQATRLAQDGIDKIRTMRDQNCPINLSGTPYYWYDKDSASLIWGQSLLSTNAAYEFIMPPPGGPGVDCGPNQPTGTGINQVGVNDTDIDGVPLPLRPVFKRRITIEDFSPTQKLINVTVEWTDLAGLHNSNLSTIVGQN